MCGFDGERSVWWRRRGSVSHTHLHLTTSTCHTWPPPPVTPDHLHLSPDHLHLSQGHDPVTGGAVFRIFGCIYFHYFGFCVCWFQSARLLLSDSRVGLLCSFESSSCCWWSSRQEATDGVLLAVSGLRQTGGFPHRFLALVLSSSSVWFPEVGDLLPNLFQLVTQLRVLLPTLSFVFFSHSVTLKRRFKTKNWTDGLKQ